MRGESIIIGSLPKVDPNQSLPTRGRYRGLGLTGQSGVDFVSGKPVMIGSFCIAQRKSKVVASKLQTGGQNTIENSRREVVWRLICWWTST